MKETDVRCPKLTPLLKGGNALGGRGAFVLAQTRGDLGVKITRNRGDDGYAIK